MRKNVTTWVDVKVLTRFALDLVTELTAYAASGYDKPTVYGDRNVMVALITLRNRINEVIAKSEKANALHVPDE